MASVLDFIEEVTVVRFSHLLDIAYSEKYSYLYDLPPYERLAGKTKLRTLWKKPRSRKRDMVFKFYLTLSLHQSIPTLDNSALAFLTELVEKEDPESCYLFAKAYCRHGLGSQTKDLIRLYLSLKSAFEGGIKEAKLPFAECLLYSIGAEKKEQDGERLLKEINSPESLRELGLLYLRKGEPIGREYLRVASEKGESYSSFSLGLSYLNGTCGEKDEKEAYEFFEKAHLAYDRRALPYLGMMNENGIGCQQNPDKALSYYEEDTENPRSIRRLADLLLINNASEKIDEAIFLYQKSSSLGDEISSLKLKELSALLGIDLRYARLPLLLSTYRKKKLAPALIEIGWGNENRGALPELLKLGYPSNQA